MGTERRFAWRRSALASALASMLSETTSFCGENATRGLIAMYDSTSHTVLGAQEVPFSQISSFGILECEPRDGVDYITRILEKPGPGETCSNLASFWPVSRLVTPARARNAWTG